MRLKFVCMFFFNILLRLDYVGRRLYWVDSTLEKIGSANLDGSDVKYVISGCPEICSPYSISVFENTLYWMDMGTIKSINTITGRNAESLLHVPGSEMSLAIKVYHDKLQDMRKRIFLTLHRKRTKTNTLNERKG